MTPRTVACQVPLSMGILQARILEWVAIPSSRGSSQPRDQTQVSRIAGGFFTNWATREALAKFYRSPKISEPVNCCRNLRHFNNSLLGNLRWYIITHQREDGYYYVLRYYAPTSFPNIIFFSFLFSNQIEYFNHCHSPLPAPFVHKTPLGISFPIFTLKFKLSQL